MKTAGCKAELATAEAATPKNDDLVNELAEKLNAAKLDEASTRSTLVQFLSLKSKDNVAEELMNNQIHLNSTRFTARITPPKEYTYGENFTTWCTRFRRYLTMANITNANAHFLLLNNVDDKTSEKLEGAADRLTAEEKIDPNLFIPIFEQVIYPSSETRVLRMELTQLTQNLGENVEDFASRIRNLASRAYGNSAVKDECCLTTFLHGIQDNDTKLDLMKAEVDSFDTAVTTAKKLERIGAAVNNSRPNLGTGDVLRVDSNTPLNNSTARRQSYNHRSEDFNNADRYNPRSGNSNYSRDQYNPRSGNSNYSRDQYNSRSGNSRRDQYNPRFGDSSYRRDHYDPRPANSTWVERRTCFRCKEVGHIQRFCVNERRNTLNSEGAGTSEQSTGRDQQQ